MRKIWERYFISETLKTFFLFLTCFYGLYVLIDYATHASNFRHYGNYSWLDIAHYYLYELVERASVIVPFAILLAVIRTLCNLNIHHELVALLASGIRIHSLLRPFLLVGLFFTALLYINTEFLMPLAANKLKHWDEARAIEKSKRNQISAVQHVALEDGSSLIFQSYDSSRDVFFDAYWIRNLDDIYRIKFLHPSAEMPMGHFVDHLVRTPAGEVITEESFPTKTFPNMHFNKQTLFETLMTPDEQSLSSLWQKLPLEATSEKEARLQSTFFYKMALPWICLLAVIAPAPYCVRFTRTLPIFFIYACSIFGLVALNIIMDAGLVLGERQVIPALWSICLPFFLISGFFSWKFLRNYL